MRYVAVFNMTKNVRLKTELRLLFLLTNSRSNAADGRDIRLTYEPRSHAGQQEQARPAGETHGDLHRVQLPPLPPACSSRRAKTGHGRALIGPIGGGRRAACRPRAPSEVLDGVRCRGPSAHQRPGDMAQATGADIGRRQPLTLVPADATDPANYRSEAAVDICGGCL